MTIKQHDYFLDKLNFKAVLSSTSSNSKYQELFKNFNNLFPLNYF